MLRTLYIDDYKLPNLFIGDGWDIPSYPLEIQKREVNARAGAVFSGTKIGPITFEIPLIYRNKFNPKTYKQILDEIIRFVKNGEEVSLRIEGEDWFWLARVSGPINFPLDVTAFAQFKLNVELLDPFKYSVNEYETTAISDQMTISNNGTADLYPVFEAVALKDTTHLMVTQGKRDYIMLGEEPQTNKTVKKVNPSVLYDKLESTNGWYYIGNNSTAFADNMTGGILGGTVKSTGASFYVDPATYPAGSKVWVGGGVKKAYSRNVQNFEHKFTVRISEATELIQKLGTGKVFTHLWSEDGRLVAAIGVVDASYGSNDVQVVAKLFDEAGEPTTIYTFKPKYDVYLDDFVYMSIKRVGTKWTFKTNTVQTIKMKTRKDKAKYGATREVVKNVHTETYTDQYRQFMLPIRSASIYIARYDWAKDSIDNNKALDKFKARAYTISTNEIGIKQSTDTDMLIEKGDKIIIDNFNQKMILNKKDATKEKDFGSNYFGIPPGVTECFVEPEGTFQVTASWHRTDY